MPDYWCRWWYGARYWASFSLISVLRAPHTHASAARVSADGLFYTQMWTSDFSWQVDHFCMFTIMLLGVLLTPSSAFLPFPGVASLTLWGDQKQCLIFTVSKQVKAGLGSSVWTWSVSSELYSVWEGEHMACAFQIWMKCFQAITFSFFPLPYIFIFYYFLKSYTFFFFFFKLWKYDNTFPRRLGKYRTKSHTVPLYITIIFLSR